MKIFFTTTLFFFLACGNKTYQPAEDALDAAREFKDGCLKGNFDKATFYLTASKENENKLNKMQESFYNQTSTEIKQSQEASIIIKSSKEINATTSQVILSNSFTKIQDTIYVSMQNKTWKVDFR